MTRINSKGRTMGSRIVQVALVLLGALALASRAADPASFAEWLAAGQAQQKDGRHAEARASYEKALAVSGITPDQSAQALLGVADANCREFKWLPANAACEKVIALNGVSDPLKARAWLGVGRVFEAYGNWEKVRAACAEALKLGPLAPDQKVQAQRQFARALVNVRQFAEARAVMRELLAGGAAPVPVAEQNVPNTVLKEYAPTETLPAEERANLQLSIAKTLMFERNYPEARAELAKAQAMPGAPDALKAEIQLHLGLSYSEAQDDEHAKTELLKVLDMPDALRRSPWDGGRMRYVPAREARLRLLMRNLLPEKNKVLKVLFIGSSHTLREDLPEQVTKLAASAPEGQPRIIAGDYVRMGTSIVTFWEAGDTPDTARGVIASEPWDAVVFETFYNMKTDEVMKYPTLFADLIRSRKALPVIYESPLPKASPWPDRFQKFHDDNVALVKALKVPVAPSVRAWMRYLGEKPTEAQFAEVYADWIHASPKGAYMSACCIYAALTGCSPVGLYAPPNIPEAEAKRLQETAWEAFRETNPP